MRSPRGEFQDLFWRLYAPVAGAAVVLVLVLVVVLVVRYRGAAPRASRADNLVLELSVAGALAVIAAVLLSQTFSAEGSVDALHRPALVVDAVGFQWGWTFAYAGTDVSRTSAPDRPPTIVLPVGETIEVRLRSRDVIHGLWVPEQRFKRLAFPDRETSFDLRFDRAGRFSGRCSTFCGLRHEDMTFVVDARPAAAFRGWLQAQRTAQ
ncbi:MAG TPA: cytochrome c oxidase subunit II [Gaiellales bacterium]|jgi:cytochrome c oxidase subunit 2